VTPLNSKLTARLKGSRDQEYQGIKSSRHFERLRILNVERWPSRARDVGPLTARYLPYAQAGSYAPFLGTPRLSLRHAPPARWRIPPVRASTPRRRSQESYRSQIACQRPPLLHGAQAWSESLLPGDTRRFHLTPGITMVPYLSLEAESAPKDQAGRPATT